MSSRSSFWSALVGVATLLVAPLALAQSEPGKPCRADVKKLCPGVKPGHGRVLACLEGKEDQVSQACKDDFKAKVQAIYDACKEDVDKYCASVEKGHGRLLQCLKRNETGLSDSCKGIWAKAKAAKAKAESTVK
jgi:hypothetical protein